MDVDIDFPPDFDPQTVFDATLASMIKNNELVKHPVGVYFQPIPQDPVTHLSAIPYEEAEQLGYQKIDFLHLNFLSNFESKEEIQTLLKREPKWELLLDEKVVSKLFQIHRHAKLLARIKPSTVQELADTIALIRPAKRMLVDNYVSNKEEIRKILYAPPSDETEYYFKRSHAISYALTIVLQLHLIEYDIL